MLVAGKVPRLEATDGWSTLETCAGMVTLCAAAVMSISTVEWP